METIKNLSDYHYLYFNVKRTKTNGSEDDNYLKSKELIDFIKEPMKNFDTSKITLSGDQQRKNVFLNLPKDKESGYLAEITFNIAESCTEQYPMAYYNFLFEPVNWNNYTDDNAKFVCTLEFNEDYRIGKLTLEIKAVIYGQLYILCNWDIEMSKVKNRMWSISKPIKEMVRESSYVYVASISEVNFVVNSHIEENKNSTGTFRICECGIKYAGDIDSKKIVCEMPKPAENS